MKKQCATVDTRGHRVYISTKSSGPGLYVPIGVPAVMEATASSESIGKTLVGRLELSCPTKELTLPSDLSDLGLPLYRAAGVTSWRQFVNGCRSLRVERNGNQIELQLLKREGLNFVLGTRSETLESPGDTVLGEAVRRLLRLPSKP